MACFSYSQCKLYKRMRKHFWKLAIQKESIPHVKMDILILYTVWSHTLIQHIPHKWNISCIRRRHGAVKFCTIARKCICTAHFKIGHIYFGMFKWVYNSNPLREGISVLTSLINTTSVTMQKISTRYGNAIKKQNDASYLTVSFRLFSNVVRFCNF